MRPTVIQNIASSDNCVILLTPTARSTTGDGRVMVAVRGNKNGKNLLAHALVNWQTLEEIGSIDTKSEYFSSCVKTVKDTFQSEW